MNLPLGYPFQLQTLKNCSKLDFLCFPWNTKHVNLKSIGKYNKRCFLHDGYAEHVQTCHILYRQNFIVLSLRFLCEVQNFSATPRIIPRGIYVSKKWRLLDFVPSGSGEAYILLPGRGPFGNQGLGKQMGLFPKLKRCSVAKRCSVLHVQSPPVAMVPTTYPLKVWTFHALLAYYSY